MQSINNTDILIKEIKLSVRAKNCLLRSGITTVGQLMNLANEDLLSIRNLGKSTLEELQEIIKSLENGETEIYCSYTNNSEQSEVDKLFQENSFNKFRNYCKNHKILSIDDLNIFDFSTLISKYGFGDKKVKNIVQRWQDIADGVYTVSDNNTSEKIYSDDAQFDFGESNKKIKIEIHDDFKSVPVNLVLPSDVATILNEQDINLLCEISLKNIIDLKSKKNIGEVKVNKFISLIKEFETPFDITIKSLFNKIKDMEGFDVFRKRIFEKMTLDSIGKLSDYNMTRERVRQIEKKFKDDNVSNLSIIEHVLYNRENLYNRDTIEYQDIVEWLQSSENAIIMVTFIEEGLLAHMSKSKYFNLIFIDKNVNIIEDEINSIIKKINDSNEIIDFNDALININESLNDNGISYIDTIHIEEYLKILEYNPKNIIFTKNKVSKMRMAEYVLGKYFENGISYTTEDINKLKKLISNIFVNSEIENDAERSVWATFADKGNCILQWDRNTRLHINHVVLDDDVLELIQTSLNNHLKYSDFVASRELYYDLIDVLKSKTNLPNEWALYGVIKYYFSDDYDLFHYTIKNKDRKSDSMRVALEKTVLKNGGEISITELKKEFHCTDVMISETINLVHNLLLWQDGFKVIHSTTFKITDNIKSNLLEIIENSFDSHGYTNANVVIDLDESTFQSIGACDTVSAFSVLKYLFQDKFYFQRRPTILKYKPETTFKQGKIVLNVMKEKAIHNIAVVRETLTRRYKIDEQIAYILVSSVKNEIFQLDKTDYCLNENINLDLQLITQIKEAINNELKEKEYVMAEDIAFSLRDMFVCVADETIQLNGIIIKEIVLKYLNDDYKIIARKTADFRFDKAIVVRVKSSFESLGDVILYILNNEYNSNNWSIEGIELFLRTNRIIANRIPEEFFQLPEVRIDKNNNIIIN